MKKRIMQRELVIDVFGPLIIGEYGFVITHYLGERNGPCKAELFHSITNGVDKMKTFKIARNRVICCIRNQQVCNEFQKSA